MSEDFAYENPRQGTSGRFLRRTYGDPETGQGSFELDIIGRGTTGFELTGFTGMQDAISDGSASEDGPGPSRRAKKIGYDYGTRKLAVEFRKNGRQGPYFVYRDVDPDTWELMRDANTSVGRTLGRLPAYAPATHDEMSAYFGR